MLWNRLAALLIGALGAVVAPGAGAADIPALRGTSQKHDTTAPRFFLHVGPAGLILDERAEIYAAGTRVDGGSIKIKSHLTFAVEAGYYLTPNLAVSFTGGLPPNVKIEASGTMDGLGRVGATTYGPTTATLHYHVTEMGRFQPYFGVGPAFMYVFDETDGIMSKLHIKHAVGYAVQAGANYMFTDRLGVFFDVKKAILRTEATGSLGAAPIKADIKLDPLVLHTGVTLKF